MFSLLTLALNDYVDQAWLKKLRVTYEHSDCWRYEHSLADKLAYALDILLCVFNLFLPHVNVSRSATDVSWWIDIVGFTNFIQFRDSDKLNCTCKASSKSVRYNQSVKTYSVQLNLLINTIYWCKQRPFAVSPIDLIQNHSTHHGHYKVSYIQITSHRHVVRKSLCLVDENTVTTIPKRLFGGGKIPQMSLNVSLRGLKECVTTKQATRGCCSRMRALLKRTVQQSL